MKSSPLPLAGPLATQLPADCGADRPFELMGFCETSRSFSPFLPLELWQKAKCSGAQTETSEGLKAKSKKQGPLVRHRRLTLSPVQCF